MNAVAIGVISHNGVQCCSSCPQVNLLVGCKDDSRLVLILISAFVRPRLALILSADVSSILITDRFDWWHSLHCSLCSRFPSIDDRPSYPDVWDAWNLTEVESHISKTYLSLHTVSHAQQMMVGLVLLSMTAALATCELQFLCCNCSMARQGWCPSTWTKDKVLAGCSI